MIRRLLCFLMGHRFLYGLEKKLLRSYGLDVETRYCKMCELSECRVLTTMDFGDKDTVIYKEGLQFLNSLYGG